MFQHLIVLQVEEEIDPEMICPEQSLFYPQRVELDLNVDMGDDHSFNVDDGETPTALLTEAMFTRQRCSQNCKRFTLAF